jgi:hypothetical protein
MQVLDYDHMKASDFAGFDVVFCALGSFYICVHAREDIARIHEPRAHAE